MDKAEGRAEETDGAEATGEAELTDEAGPKSRTEEAEEQTHTDPADLLSIPIDRLEEIARDPEAAAGIFVQARGGEPLECPKCRSRAHTKRAPGIKHRSDLFRCTPCKTEFGIKTGTVMHGSRETLGNWLIAIKLMVDTGGAASARDLSDLTGTAAGFADDMITAIRPEMGSPSGLLAAVAQLKERTETKEAPGTSTETPDPGTTSLESPDPEKPSLESPGQETGSGAATRVDPPSGPITELSLDGMIELAGDDIACAGLFMAARDQDGIDCPRCGLREETKRIGPSRPVQFRCGICNSIYSVRTGTPMEGPTVSLAKWAMAGYLAATGSVPEYDIELALLIGTTEKMARRIMETAIQACPEGQDPIPALVQVVARRPQDGQAEMDTDTTPQEPQGDIGTDAAEKGTPEDGPEAGPQNGSQPGSSGAADQPEEGKPESGADILSPDG